MSVDGRIPTIPVVVAPLELRASSSLPDGVRLEEPAGGSPGATYPAGFVASGVVAGLKESGRPDMGVAGRGSGVARRRPPRRPSSPPTLRGGAGGGQPRRRRDLAHLLAVVMNSGNANACTGADRVWRSPGPCRQACAETLGVPAANVRPWPPPASSGCSSTPAFMAAGDAPRRPAAVEPGRRARLRPRPS